jgi:hypothetical protein
VLTKDQDPVLSALCNAATAVTLVKYVRDCVTPVCALQAFIAVTPRILPLIDAAERSGSEVDLAGLLEVGTSLAAKLKNEPEVVLYIFRHFRVFHFLGQAEEWRDSPAWLGVAADVLSVAGRLAASPSASPLLAVERKLQAAREVRETVMAILDGKVEILCERKKYWPVELWRLVRESALLRLDGLPQSMQGSGSIGAIPGEEATRRQDGDSSIIDSVTHLELHAFFSQFISEVDLGAFERKMPMITQAFEKIFNDHGSV